LTRSVTSVFAIQVVVNNVPQNAREAYGITASNQIVFTSAPSAGTNNIYVIYDSQVGQFVTPSPGTVTASALTANAVTTNAIAPGAVTTVGLDVSRLDGTGAMVLPAGTTAQRPASPVVGMIRFNTTLGYLEEFRLAQWLPLSQVFLAIGGVETLISSGGRNYKVHTFTSSGAFTVQAGSTAVEYLVVAGGGGGASYTGSAYIGGLRGANSVFGSITSIGGGGGKAWNVGAADTPDGGSGGGGGANTTAGGSGTSGQGFAGGTGQQTTRLTGGGGGGASAVGANATTTNNGNGGTGVSSSINGTATFRAGGGGGGSWNSGGGYIAGSGGAGGGGNGAISARGSDGTPNTGGGAGSGDAGPGAGHGGGGAGGYRSSVVGETSGGGSVAESRLSLGVGSYTVTVGAGGAGSLFGGNGGSGIVIIRYEI
jgi:hypothetical protein